MKYWHDYRHEVLRTANLHATADLEKASCMGALGLAGETGEVVDLIKKTVFHGKPLDREKLIAELGDVRWYFEYLLAVYGLTMGEVEHANIEKLRKRYPTGFSAQAASERKDEV